MVHPVPHRQFRAAQAAAGRARGLVRRQFITRNRRLSLVLAAVTVGIGIAGVHVSYSWFSPGVMILPILAGGMLLWPRALLILFGVVAVTLAYDVIKGRAGPGIIATIVVTAAFAHVLARTRAKLGVQGLRGDQMLIELRDRIRAQGKLPGLPEGWRSASVLQPAGGASFGGDFLVSASDGKTLEVALVDVPGKGIDAGTRALLLSAPLAGCSPRSRVASSSPPAMRTCGGEAPRRGLSPPCTCHWTWRRVTMSFPPPGTRRPCISTRAPAPGGSPRRAGSSWASLPTCAAFPSRAPCGPVTR